LPLYECNEYQFVENIRRFIETQEKFVVNRKLSWHDDAKYGLATLPEEEFSRYSAICYRKSLNSTVICRVPFINGFYRRAYNEGEILHAASNLKFPKMSIPYYRVEFSLNVWGGTYFFTFDALFDPEITMEKRRDRKFDGTVLIHVLKYTPPHEKILNINLPKQVIVFDVKKMIRVIDYSSIF
jgi:hypothetical protein